MKPMDQTIKHQKDTREGKKYKSIVLHSWYRIEMKVQSWEANNIGE